MSRTAERAARARSVAEANGRQVGRPADKIDYARLRHGQGGSYGEISAKTGIPKASLHRYIAAQGHREGPERRVHVAGDRL